MRWNGRRTPDENCRFGAINFSATLTLYLVEKINHFSTVTVFNRSPHVSVVEQNFRPIGEDGLLDEKRSYFSGLI
jgi:hypothetical protein